MRRPINAFLMRALAVILLLSATVAAAGCGNGDDHIQISEDVAAMMKMMPRGTDAFGYFDVEALRSDNDLAVIYQGLGEWETAVRTLGIPPEDFSAMATDVDDTVVFKGDFDLDEIRDVLDDGGMDDDEYLGVEIWEESGVGVALVSETSIIFQTSGDIEDCVDAMKGKRASVYDDEDIAEGLSGLPAGLFLVYGGAGNLDFFEDDYDGLEATAVSVAKKDSDALEVMFVFQFEDEDAADDAFEEVEADVTADPDRVDADSIKIKRDGRYIEVSADAPMDIFA